MNITSDKPIGTCPNNILTNNNTNTSISKLTPGESNLCLYQHIAPLLLQHGFDDYSVYFNVTRIAFAIFKTHHSEKEDQPSDSVMSIRYTRRFKKYFCPLPKYNCTFQFQYELDCVKNIKNIQIHLYFPSTFPGAHICDGGLKKVKKSITFILPNGDINAIQIIPTVVQRFNEKCSSIESHLQGIKIQRILNSMLATDSQLAADPWVIEYYSKHLIKKHEIVQQWYNGDLELAKYPLPLEQHLTSLKVNIDRPKKIDALIKFTAILDFIHVFGYVHGDLKSPNILIEIKKNLDVIYHLSDFDFIQQIGETIYLPKMYTYWDDCFQHGFALPSTDLQGLAYTFATTLFPHSVKTIINPNFVNDEIAQGQLLRQVANISITRRAPSLIKHLNRLYLLASPKREVVMQRIKDALQQEMLQPTCSEFSKREMRCLETEITAYNQTIQLLVNQIHLNKLLWEKLSMNLEWQNTLKYGTLEEKQITYMLLTKTVEGFPTAEDMGNSFREIQKLFLSDA